MATGNGSGVGRKIEQVGLAVVTACVLWLVGDALVGQSRRAEAAAATNARQDSEITRLMADNLRQDRMIDRLSDELAAQRKVLLDIQAMTSAILSRLDKEK